MRGVRRFERRYNAKKGHGERVECFYVDGKEVTKKEYEESFPNKQAGKPFGIIGTQGDWKKAVHSDGLAVVPKRIKEFETFCAKHGVPTDFSTNRGRPIIKNNAHHKKLLKVLGFHHNEAFY